MWRIKLSALHYSKLFRLKESMQMIATCPKDELLLRRAKSPSGRADFSRLSNTYANSRNTEAFLTLPYFSESKAIQNEALFEGFVQEERGCACS